MNQRQLEKLGVPADCCAIAIAVVQKASSQLNLRGRQIKDHLKRIIASPTSYEADPVFSPLAQAMLQVAQPISKTPIEYPVWGDEIDPAVFGQMRAACALPHAVAAALMPDAHVGYGLPIGGVLATEGVVIPFAVGVDIACRMKLSVIDRPVADLKEKVASFKKALESATRFGIGCEFERPHQHPVMERDWSITRITREKKDLAWRQLGTSGSGNHFVEFGSLTIENRIEEIGLDAGEYIALLSHSGSRGPGSSVCDSYSNIARALAPRGRREEVGRLAWLDLASEAGQEYWAAMQLMGEYAAANHDVIHRQVTKLLGGQILASIENHHNFAWKERHLGRELIVHRKGATPAQAGQLGVIPGTMADPAFLVRGKGNALSLHSAAHGAGRRMSRRAANDRYRWKAVQKDLEKKDIHVLSAGSDEVPGVYKDIQAVMRQQRDLVDVLGTFQPRIIKMCGDGSDAED